MSTDQIIKVNFKVVTKFLTASTRDFISYPDKYKIAVKRPEIIIGNEMGTYAYPQKAHRYHIMLSNFDVYDEQPAIEAAATLPIEHKKNEKTNQGLNAKKNYEKAKNIVEKDQANFASESIEDIIKEVLNQNNSEDKNLVGPDVAGIDFSEAAEKNKKLVDEQLKKDKQDEVNFSQTHEQENKISSQDDVKDIIDSILKDSSK